MSFINQMLAMLAFVASDSGEDAPDEYEDSLNALVSLDLIIYEKDRWALTDIGEDYFERQLQTYH